MVQYNDINKISDCCKWNINNITLYLNVYWLKLKIKCYSLHNFYLAKIIMYLYISLYFTVVSH